MERIFVVEGVPNTSLVYRGVILQSNKRFKANMTKKELEDFREFISIISCEELRSEVKTEKQISEPIIKPKQETKPKEAKANDGARKKVNKQVKV